MTDMLIAPTSAERAQAVAPRIGFLGTGWIGRHRMEAILRTGSIAPVGVCDPSPEGLAAALDLAPDATKAGSLDELLCLGLDGLVIATPSAQHAEQARRALEAGVAVFCQKPLGRTAREVETVVEAARRADRLLAVDLSYRFTRGMRAIRDLLQAEKLGPVFACELVFHNAYGPDKPWFYQPELSGGGCVMDLGVHLVDLVLWALGFPKVAAVESRLYASGRRLSAPIDVVEDFADVVLELETGAVVRIGCSWRLHAGRDAIIEAVFHGRDGGAEFQNVGGSFYDFTAVRTQGTSAETLVGPPDDWGGGAARAWASRLAAGRGFDPACEELVESARVLDRIYGR